MSSGVGAPAPAATTSGVSLETQVWVDAAKELTPPKTVAQMADNARFVVTTMSLVAAVITGFGIVGADRLADSDCARLFAIAAVVAAVAGVAVSLDFLRQRTHSINTSNLAEVQQWYLGQLSRGWQVSTAGLLLLAAVALAGAAAVSAALGNRAISDPQVVLEVQSNDGGLFASGLVTCSGCGSRKAFDLRVVDRGDQDSGAKDQLCLQAAVNTDGDGKFRVPTPLCSVSDASTVLVYIDGEIVSRVHAG